MSTWAVIFLGVIAVATLATAVIQIALIVHAIRLARQVARLSGRVTRVVDDVEREIKPLLASATAVGHDAARVSSLAVAQAERVDRVFDDLVRRMEQTLTAVQRVASVVSPTREWAAILAGLRAAYLALSRSRRSETRRTEEDEALFI